MRLRLSIRRLLLIVALVAVPLGGWAECARRNARAVARSALIAAQRQARARAALPTPAVPVVPY